MNRKEWNILVESWNKYLNESPVDISGINKIKSLIDRIILLREEAGKEIWVDVYFNGTVLEVILQNYSIISLNKIYYQKAWLNHNGIIKRDVRVKGDKEPYVIKYSEVGGGFGPLLYEIGLEVISCYLNGALMSDRAEVSSDAERVWSRYKRRADSEFNLEAVKMDFSDESWEDVMYNKPFSDMSEEEQEKFKNTEKYTKDDPTDDIYQYSAILNAAENGNFVDGNWSNFESPLAYAYFKKEPEVINYIKDLEKDLGYSLLSIVL